MARSFRFVVATLVTAALLGTQAQGTAPSAGCSRNDIQEGRRIEKRISVGGREREYILDVPPGLRAGDPVRLLFDFHGFGHSGAGVWQVSRFRELAEKHRFITVYPTGIPITLTLRGQSHTAPGWEMEMKSDNRDIAFTRAMLAEIESRYCIDRDRVFSTGFSNGAFFSSLLGCAMSETFAAVAPVAGGALRGDCQPKRPVPILIQHGTKDDLIPLERARAGRDQWLAANGCQPAKEPARSPACQRYDQCRDGAAVVYCEEEYAHRWPIQATDRIWNFFEKAAMDRASGAARSR